MTGFKSKPASRPKPEVTAIKPAGPEHQVVTVTGGKGVYRRTVCPGCPWRCSNVGEFPAEAFRHSATTAYDMALNTFACHEVGAKKPAICAGFLLRGASHNMTVRLKLMKGEMVCDVQEPEQALFENYRAMAVANGVSPDDPAIGPCRD